MNLIIITVVGIFYFIVLLFLLALVTVGKDADGKEDQREYWEYLEYVNKRKGNKGK